MSDRELVAADAAAHRVRRQRLLQPRGDRDDELVAAEHAELRVDVVHAVEFDQREGRALIVGALGQREIEQFERLGVVGQAGELVFVGGAARLLLARRQLPPRALELPERQARQSRPATMATARRTASAAPSPPESSDGLLSQVKKSGDAAVAESITGCISRSPRPGSLSNFRSFRPAICSAMRTAADRLPPDWSSAAEFGDGAAQRGVLLERQPLVVLARQAVADGGDHEHAARRQTTAAPISREADRIHFAGVGRVNASDGVSGRFVQAGSQPRGREPAGSALVSCTGGSQPAMRRGV